MINMKKQSKLKRFSATGEPVEVRVASAIPDYIDAWMQQYVTSKGMTKSSFIRLLVKAEYEKHQGV
jgi:hypothetical protein